jgi:hypothetical protein
MSMHGFVKNVVAPLLSKRGWTSVCEVGASYGASTDVLASVPNVAITVVDPCLDCNLEQKYANNERVRVRKGASLEILPKLKGSFDCILIDGDHNWYTVYNELRVIFDHGLLRKLGMIFFHDVHWPYGRRDMYYQPELIPAEYRHNYEKKGIVPEQSELSESAGFNPAFWNATHEGGARNGVLTAIEDFVSEHRKECRFFQVQEQFGLGVMCRREGLRDDLALLHLYATYKISTSSKTFTRTHFPLLFRAAKSLLGKRKVATPR